ARPALLASAKRVAESVEAGFPQRSIPGDPCIQLLEGLRTERVDASRPVRADVNEAGLVEDAQMARYAGLVDIDRVDDVVDGALTAPPHFDDVASGGIGERLKNVQMHTSTYVYQCILFPSSLFSVVQEMGRLRVTDALPEERRWPALEAGQTGRGQRFMSREHRARAVGRR